MRPYLALYIGGMGVAREELLQPARDALRLRRRGRRRSRTCISIGKYAEAMAEIPDELIDKVALMRPEGGGRRSASTVYRDAGVGTLLVTPGGRHARTTGCAMLRDLAEIAADVAVPPERRFACSIGAFGDAGHAFPAIALGNAARARAATRSRSRRGASWREHVEREGMRFYAAPEYQVFPTRERPLKPYEAVVRAVAETRPAGRGLRARRRW